MRLHLLAILLLAILLEACSSSTSKDRRLHSPDGKLALAFTLMEGVPHYSLAYADSTLIQPSRLGFELRGAADLFGGFEMLDSSSSTHESSWDLPWGEWDSVHDHHNEMYIKLREKAGPHREMHLQFRAFNDGVAFRYHLPGKDSIFILEENTGFRFAGNYMSWSIPPDHDTYEHLYRRLPLDSLEGGNTPLTLQAHDNVHLSIHEAALIDYPEMALVRDSAQPWTLRAHLAPWPDGDRVKAKLPLSTPWRTIQVSPTAGKLLESTMILNLNEPSKIADLSWIQPSKYIGIWWGMHVGKNTWSQGPKHGATTDETARYIRFADSAGVPAVLVEGWNTGWERWGQVDAWDYVTPYSDFDLPYLANLAQEKHVQLVGHHETGGDVLGYEKMLDSAFAQCARLGMRVVKTGYAGKIKPEGHVHHNQWMVRHYQRVVEIAAKHKVMVDAHEPIKDTGLRRTWPNFMTREGVRGMEWNAWSAGNPPSHTCILPFTRMLSGPLDYTPGIFVNTYEPWKDGYQLASTRARQLAYMVILYSPLQMAADLVEHYEGQPEWDFIRRVPCDWDEVRSQNETIGEHAVVARRAGEDWWIGAITDAHARLVQIQTDFLSGETEWVAEIWADMPNSSWYKDYGKTLHRSFGLQAGETIPATMAGCGGMAVHLRKAQPGEVAGLPHVSKLRENDDATLEGFRAFRIHGQIVKAAHEGQNAVLSVQDSASSKYMKGDVKVLQDGLFAGMFPQEQGWLGFEGKDLVATLRLPKAVELKNIVVGFLRNHGSAIFLPKALEFSVSTDGEEWTVMDAWDNVQYQDRWQEGPKVFHYVASPLRGFQGEFAFVRVKAKAVGNAPAWHWHKGKPAWLFVNEIAVNPAPGTWLENRLCNPRYCPQDADGELGYQK